MEPTWKADCLSLYKGDSRLILPSLDADSFTACVTDPPYHLTTGKKGGSGAASLNVNSPAGRSRVTTGFMGKAWDGGDVAMRPETWAEVYRVLKPGGYLLAFGGTRTFHRITCAIEDAGFEIRDCIMWVYGSGFPKSLDVSKAIDKAAGEQRERIRGVRSGIVKDTYAQDAWSKEFKDSVLSSEPITDAAKLWQGYGTALKPAWEPIIVARKPLSGTVAENCLTHGCGALNIDGCRIGSDLVTATAHSPRQGYVGNSPPDASGSHKWNGCGPSTHVGRWPANLIHDGSDEVLAGFPDAPGQQRITKGTEKSHTGDENTSCYGKYNRVPSLPPRLDSGSAARFFYCAKASRSDRGEGNTHPTVKPLALMEYLVRLVTMPGDGNRIIDPFAGSGTTLLACYNAFVEAAGIDLEADHIDISSGRVAKELRKTPLFADQA